MSSGEPKATAEFGAIIPRTLYEEFKTLFPGYGSTTWFIQTSLEEFLAEVRQHPSLRQHVQKSVMKMLADNRNS